MKSEGMGIRLHMALFVFVMKSEGMHSIIGTGLRVVFLQSSEHMYKLKVFFLACTTWMM